jgi:hypothetical protein
VPPNEKEGCVWLTIPQPAKWQRIGNQIGAAFVVARADFVNVHESFGLGAEADQSVGIR